MDTNAARRVLRIDERAPLTAETVEAAYSREAWERHPSRYPEGEARVAADAWAGTLAEARAVLLDSVLRAEAAAASAASAASATPAAPATTAQPGPWAPAGPAPAPAPVRAGPWAAPAVPSGQEHSPAPRRRTGLVIGIVAASLGAVALVVALAFGALGVIGMLADGGGAAAPTSTATAPSGDTTGAVTRYESGETLYTFPAALEQYSDGRYGDLCPTTYAEGCWEWALFTVDDCSTLQVDFAYSNDPDPSTAAQARESTTYTNVVADTAQPVVFGNDDYDIAWINDVTCLD